MRLLSSLFLLIVFQFAQAQTLPLLNEPGLPRFETTLNIPEGTRLIHPITDREFPMDLADSFQMALEVLRYSLDSKGLSATVLAANGDIWNGATGISSLTKDMTPDMYLGMGSLSKSITAATILKLEEMGKVNIDAPIEDYLSEFPNVLGSITIRQLLNHTSGIFDVLKHPSILDSMQANTSRIWLPTEILNTFVNEPDFLPGTSWKYSNSNYILAGLIIEEVTEVSYHEAVKTLVLAPAGLEDIFLNPYETATGEVAHIWIYNENFQTKLDIDALGATPISIYSTAWAAGAYFSTPEQVAKWLNALLTGQVLSSASLDKMQNFVPANSNEYGLGLMKITNGAYSFIGHQGYILYSSLCFFDPTTKLTISIQSNDATSQDLSAFLAKAYIMYIAKIVGHSKITNLQGEAIPNPANNQVELLIPSGGLKANYQIQVVDVLGRHLAVKKIFQNDRRLSIDISSLQSGVYYIRLNDGVHQIIYRVLVS